MAKKKKKSAAGRPTVMTQEVLELLIGAFALGHTDEEACLVADIDPKTLYNYCDKNPDFSSRKELLKNTPHLNARRNIMVAIDKGDVPTSKWFMERKTEEFREKRDLDHTTDGQKIRGVILMEGDDGAAISADGESQAGLVPGTDPTVATPSQG